jgi:hypothetical protein
MNLFLILLIIAGVAFVVWILKDKRKREAENSDDAQNRVDNIQQVGAGVVLSLRGIGDDIEDFDIVVQAKHLYVEDGFEWHELECERGAEKVWIEIEMDDELELSICRDKMSIKDAGFSVDDLERIERDDDGKLTVNGVKYIFEDWGEATFYRNQNRSQGEQFKYWDFESKDGRKFLTVERWGQREYQVFLSEELRPSQYRII